LEAFKWCAFVIWPSLLIRLLGSRHALASILPTL
jgi:hypothetical protein